MKAQLKNTAAQIDLVAIDTILGSISEAFPAASDPKDIPEMIYSSKFTSEFNLELGASGHGAFVLRPYRFGSTSISASSSFICYNVDGSYNPDTGLSGIWNPVDSPWAAAGATLVEQVKPLGLIVTVRPQVSTLSNQGTMVFGLFARQVGANSAGLGASQVLTYSSLSLQPYFRNTDLKHVYSTRLIGHDGGFVDVSGTGGNNNGNFVLIVKGAAPSAIINLRYTVVYSVRTSVDAAVILRPSLPPIGPYTTQFYDFLRSQFPDIVNWASDDIDALCSKLKDCSPSYARLARCALSAIEAQRKK